MAFSTALDWHPGEDRMHSLLRVPNQDNPTSPFMTPFASHLLMRSPLLAIGTLDEEDRPWTTILGGEPGFSRSIAQSVVGLNTTVDRQYDPVIEILFGKEANGEVVKEKEPGRMIGGLAIDLESRMRVKMYGRMLAGALSVTEEGAGEVQLVVKIEQSLGNCPKYLNKKHVIPRLPLPRLVSDTIPLPQKAVDLLAKADLFFISSSNHKSDMDTNHRGGPPGFTRLLSNDENGCALVYPEYSGNRLYQTLGNLVTTPRAGLVFPDFDTGDVLYVTGTTDILVGEAAAKVLPRTNLAVKINIEAVRFVAQGLPFRAIAGELSPYNPPVRLLSSEFQNQLPSTSKRLHAKLISKTRLTPTIARFRFHVIDSEKGKESTITPSPRWKPGQYVALSFEDELSMGYSHMRDDDPQSLNDDFIRTFTVSSLSSTPTESTTTSDPKPNPTQLDDDFEITIRSVGVATENLFRHNTRTEFELPVLGFGGEFYITPSSNSQDRDSDIAFIAGGIGITPLLAQAGILDLTRLRLFWTVRGDDLGLVADSLSRLPGLGKSTTLFVTSLKQVVKKETTDKIKEIENMGARIIIGRLSKEELLKGGEGVGKWYVCASTGLRKNVVDWLQGRGEVLWEDFGY